MPVKKIAKGSDHLREISYQGRPAFRIEHAAVQDIALSPKTIMASIKKIKQLDKRDSLKALRKLQQLLNSWGFAITLICPSCSDTDNPVELLIKWESAAYMCPRCQRRIRIRQGGRPGQDLTMKKPVASQP